MEVLVEDISSVKKKIQVQIPHEDVVRELDSAYLKLKKTVKIKGFRPGKVPRSTLERMFKKDVHTDVAGTLIQNSLIDAIREKDLPVVGTPKIDPPELDPEGPFTYNATVELRPRLAPVAFKGVELIQTLYSVKPEEIDRQIALMQKQLAELRPISETRPVREGDYVIIDYEGFKDGEPFAETQKTENHTLKIGQGSMTDEFDRQIIGLLPGQEKQVVGRFPQGYPNSKLAEQEITFHVVLKEIREEVLPEINDELAKKMDEFETLEELREAVRKSIQNGYDRRSEQELKEQIFKKLMTEEFEVPDALVQAEIEEIIYDLYMKFFQNNLSLEQLGLTREQIAQDYRKTAENQVRQHLFLGQIIEQEKLEITDDELESGYESFSRTFGQSVHFIKEYYKKNPEKLSGFRRALLEKKAIDLIIQHAEIKKVEPKEEKEENIGGSSESA